MRGFKETAADQIDCKLSDATKGQLLGFSSLPAEFFTQVAFCLCLCPTNLRQSNMLQKQSSLFSEVQLAVLDLRAGSMNSIVPLQAATVSS